MFSNKALLFSSIASLVLHVAASPICSQVASWKKSREAELIEISYIQRPQPEPKAAVLKPLPKKAVEIPKPVVVEQKPKSEIKKTPAAPALPVATLSKPVPVLPVEAKNAVLPPFPGRGNSAQTVQAMTSSSQELLTDPKKGRVFANYFGFVKEKIHRTVRSGYSRQRLGGGTVSLFFVLYKDGSLESVSIVERQSQAPAAVTRFAMQCVRDAAPFMPFPKDLGTGRIAFNIIVFLE